MFKNEEILKALCFLKKRSMSGTIRQQCVLHCIVSYFLAQSCLPAGAHSHATLTQHRPVDCVLSRLWSFNIDVPRAMSLSKHFSNQGDYSQ